MWRRLGVLLVAMSLLAAGCGASKSSDDAPPATTGAQQITHPDIGFRDRRHLVDHYEKHGREFGRITIDEYLRMAQALRDATGGGPVEEIIRRDRVVTRFDQRAGSFIAFDRDLVIRTFFRPNDGEAYFRRQARASH